ncbi:MAG: hypothetical protein K1X57_19675, partial [Gemmataceae bacterium]|nr:hypothetical protein [Gemmataceae bacterium]
FNLYGSVSATNTTFTANTALGGGGNQGGSAYGGAIFNLNGTVTLNFVTASLNTVTAGGGGAQAGGVLYNLAYGNTPTGGTANASATITNSILANSVGAAIDLVNNTDRTKTISAVPGTATVTLIGANIIRTSVSEGPAGGISGPAPLTADPNLGALASNGGPTQTMALPANSPAAGVGMAVSGISTDQRGYTSPTYMRLDLGAYQHDAGKLETPSLVVSTTADVVNPVDGVTSLREAMALANNQAGADTITFAPALSGQTVMLANGWTDAADLSALRVNSGEVTVQGPAAGNPITLAVDVTGPNRQHVAVANGAKLTLSGQLTITAGRGASGGAVYNAGELILDGVTLTGNTASGLGGAVYNDGTLSVARSTFANNTGNEAGAIQSVGTLTIDNSTFTANDSKFNGGALRLFGATTIRGSTFNGNTVFNQGGALINLGNLVISNSTFADNGKDAVLLWDGTADVTNATITNNSNGGLTNVLSTTNLRNSVVAGNIGGDLLGNPLTAASTNNLVNLSASAAGLGTLASNGGPTQTVALLPGSPAINAGTSSGASPLDQRGLPRVGAVDIGAFEVQVWQPAKVSQVQINGGDAQRSRVLSVAVTFDHPVTFAGNPAAAFELRRQSDNKLPNLAAAVNSTRDVVTLTFLAGDAVEFGSLADGRYTLSVKAANFLSDGLDGDGNGTGGDDYTLVGDTTNKLFRLFGDADGNGQVTSGDFLAFRIAFLSASPAFDFDGNGSVDSGDFLQFRLRFLQSV